MQSYQLHEVSEHLKDRHPYLELAFNERYDPSEVYLAVFDRSIPKLIEILCMPGLNSDTYKNAFITLNEMVSHQENKDIMINSGLLQIASQFMLHQVPEIQRESILLVGSMCSIMHGRENCTPETVLGIKQLLFSDITASREACGWCIFRFALSRDGVEFLANKALVSQMIVSFLKYSENAVLENAKFLIYLLEAFVLILQFDNGIIFFLKTKMVNRLNHLLLENLKKPKDQNEFIREYKDRVNQLLFDCLNKITVNMDGKVEGIDEKVISTSSGFIDKTNKNQKEVQYAVLLIMSCTIHLQGKKQAVFVQNDTIIKKLIALLDSQDEELRKNVKQTLINISDLPEGWLIITKHLTKKFNPADKSNYLEEIFGAKIVKGLAELLPKTSELQDPPFLPDNNEKVQEYKNIISALCYFLKKYDESIDIAIEQTVKIVEKIAPYLIYRGEKTLQYDAYNALFKICSKDEYSKELLIKYLNQYGDNISSVVQTSLNSEISQKYSKLYDLIQFSEKNHIYT